jgi:lipopolysaccharide/colanic/teichoic acid biosynthesis glycosyltransferase
VITKRIFDFILSLCGLIILSPLFLFIAVWIKLDSRGPVLFRQERVGYAGRTFQIHKFRTMFSAATGMLLTVGDDPRITRCGRFLRRFKLDEFPQLIDVLKGDMSLVGPRPEVPRYMAQYPEDIRKLVLSVPPGITDIAAIKFKNENELLKNSNDLEKDYINKILPIKIKYYQEYISRRSLALDLKLIFQTIKAIFTD